MKDTNTQKKTLRLDSGVVSKVENLARKENRNFNNMVETILMRATDNRNRA